MDFNTQRVYPFYQKEDNQYIRILFGDWK